MHFARINVIRAPLIEILYPPLEALGVVWALHHFQPYLLGYLCVVVTDHAPLRAMLKACHSSGQLARWSQTIAEFDVSIDLEGNAQMLMPCSEVPLNQLVNLWEILAKYQ